MRNRKDRGRCAAEDDFAKVIYHSFSSGERTPSGKSLFAGGKKVFCIWSFVNACNTFAPPMIGGFANGNGVMPPAFVKGESMRAIAQALSKLLLRGFVKIAFPQIK